MMPFPESHVALSVPDPVRKAVLAVTLKDLDVRYASPLAVDWLNLPADRLLGRSLMLSIPPLGQALIIAIAAGLSPLPTLLSVAMLNPNGSHLRVFVHRMDNNVIIDFEIADEVAEKSESTPGAGNHLAPDALGLQRRMDEMKQDLAALRTRIPCDEAMLRGDDPILFWLWQAEAAISQVSLRFSSLCTTERKATGRYSRPTAP